MEKYSYKEFLKEIEIYPIEKHWRHAKITHGNILWDKD